MAKDHYATLGISRTASQDEIKAAFKRLAKKHHPDLNKDNKVSEAAFKEVNDAYQVLGDEKRRAQYDRFGTDKPQQGGPTEGFDGGFDINLGDIFGDFFGGGSRRSRRGSDIEVLVRISLEEAAKGAPVSVAVDRRSPCSGCNGTGAEGGKRSTCSTCKGQGQVRRAQRTPFGVVQMVAACENCNGAGSVAEKACKRCRGSGSEEREEKMQVDVPPGIGDRMQLRVPGKGNAGAPGQPAGDLLVGVFVEEHELFTRDGDDLLLQSTISYPQAVLGTSLEVPTLTGSVTLAVPAGTSSHSTLRARGKGMPKLRGGQGDLLVTVLVDIPKNPSKKERELIEQLAGVEKPKGFFGRLGL